MHNKIPFVLIIIVLLFSELLVISSANVNAFEVESIPGFKLWVSEKPTLDKQVTISAQVSSRAIIHSNGSNQTWKHPDGWDIKLAIALPEGFEPINGKDTWEGSLDSDKGEVVTLSSTVKAVKRGNWVIEAVIFYKNAEGYYVPYQSKYLYVTVGRFWTNVREKNAWWKRYAYPDVWESVDKVYYI